MADEPLPVWLRSDYDQQRHAFRGNPLASEKKTASAVCTHSLPHELLHEDLAAPLCILCVIIVGNQGKP